MKRIIFFTLLFFLSGATVYAVPSKEDFNQSEQLRNLHDVMIAQRERLQATQDAFLVGDIEVIRANAAEIYSGIGQMDVAKKAEEKDAQEEAWVAMMRVASHARDMKDAAESGRLDDAYEEYYQMTAQCMSCHAALRDSR